MATQAVAVRRPAPFGRLPRVVVPILVLVVLCMTVLLGFMALAIDVGLLFRARRNVQIAADAAAAGAFSSGWNHGTALVSGRFGRTLSVAALTPRKTSEVSETSEVFFAV